MTARPAAAAAVAFTIICLLVSLALPAADARANSVVGQVTDLEGYPVSALLVRLIPRFDQAPPADDPKSKSFFQPATTLTDDNGEFQFDNVAPGRYMLIAGTIRRGMNTQRFVVREGQHAAINMIINAGIPRQAPEFVPMDFPPLVPDVTVDQEKMDIGDGRDARRVRARNEEILRSMDDDDDAGVGITMTDDGSGVGLSRVQRARRGILGDDDDRFGDDDDRFGDDDDRFGDDDDDDLRELRAGREREDDDDDDDRNEINDDDDDNDDRNAVTGSTSDPRDIVRGGTRPGGVRDIVRGGPTVGGTSDIARPDRTVGGTRDIVRPDNTVDRRDISRSDRRRSSDDVSTGDDSDRVNVRRATTPRLRTTTPTESRLRTTPRTSSTNTRPQPAPSRLPARTQNGASQ